MDKIKIITPGGYTTIQDKGRFGFQHMGIPVSGVLDDFAFTMANLLVGNHGNAAVMELTVMGPSIEIREKMDIALTGAKMRMVVNDNLQEQWCSIRVKPGDIVNISQVQAGCRAYLSFSGGISLPEVMGSFSTYAGAKIGGFKGRPLQKGDTLATFDAPLLKRERVLLKKFIPDYPTHVCLRAILGPQDHYFGQSLKTLFSEEYMVTAKADRMGYRLQGKPLPIKHNMPKSIISEPSMPGSIQVPPSEQPIILLVEQTVGGYAKIATIISSDIAAVAQVTPGDTIRFEKIDINNAIVIAIEREKIINTIKETL